MNSERQIDDYLSILRNALGPITLDEREEIVREIHAHIRDAVEQPGIDAGTVLQRLGPATELAEQYRDGILIHRASRSFSPLLLLRATLRVTSKGVFGILVFFCGLFGYVIGAGFITTAFVKCIFPQNVGVWMIGGHFVDSGGLFPPPPPPAHEILGWWYIPIAFVIGSLMLICTTTAIRFFLRTSHRWQSVLRAPNRRFEPSQATGVR